MIKQVIWSSTIDWPDQMSTVLFFGDCNFKCYYCHNRDLVKQESINFDEILEKLIERKSIVDHVILSGGEPTISDDYFHILKKLYENGFKIGLHTNGSRPYIVRDSIDKHGVSFVGLDIKAGNNRSYFDNYISEWEDSFGYDHTLFTLHLLWQRKDKIELDVRTTLSKYLKISEIVHIGNQLKEYVNQWNLQYEVQNNKQIKYFTQDKYDSIVNELKDYVKVNYR